jgi:hypothetical protein
MVAPASPGLHHFTLHFTPGDARGKPHALAQAQFSIMVADAPDHAVEVSIIDEETGEPINEAHVRLGIYRLSTHDQGRVRFAVPKGEHRLFVWKAGFEIPEKTVIVEQDLNLTVAAKALPKKNPYERWQG